jgi:hypothetical protein
MRNIKYIWIVVTGILIAGVVLYWGKVRVEDSDNESFVSNIESLSKVVDGLSTINGFTIERKANSSVSINGFVADPSAQKYFTTHPVQIGEYASGTSLTIEQLHTLFDLVQKLSYVQMIRGDVNIGGKCDGRRGTYACTAVEFYLRPSLLSMWFSDPTSWYSSGYIYVPASISATSQNYFRTHFYQVTEIAPDWFSFHTAR